MHRCLGDDARLVWYGSWVKGTARRASDIDLAIKRPSPISHAKMEMLDDRNRDSHTYDEAFAHQLYSRLSEYPQHLLRLLDILRDVG